MNPLAYTEYAAHQITAFTHNVTYQGVDTIPGCIHGLQAESCVETVVDQCGVQPWCG
jgi:alpha-galactosidase/6-phospho-beta-glucosidase family protein